MQEAISNAEQVLGQDGRVFVRYSGTEQKARIMIEGKESDLVRELAEKIVVAFQEEVGA